MFYTLAGYCNLTSILLSIIVIRFCHLNLMFNGIIQCNFNPYRTPYSHVACMDFELDSVLHECY